MTILAIATPLLAREGAVVVSVVPGSPAADAGLRPGDRVVSWSRPASLPANPQAADGRVHSWLDLLEAEVEEGPRGPTALGVERDGEVVSVTLAPERWGVDAGPDVSGVLPSVASEDSAEHEADLACWTLYSSAIRFAEGRDAAAADNAARDLVARVLARRKAGAAAWLASRIAGKQFAYGARDAGQRLLDETLEQVEKVRPAGLAMALILAMDGRFQESSSIPELMRAPAARALPLLKAQAPRSGLMAYVLSSLGAAASSPGATGSSDGDFLQQALDLRIALAPGSHETAGSLISVGNQAFLRRDLETADRLHRQALEIEQRLAPGSALEAWVRIELARNSTQRMDLDEAEDQLKAALAIYDKKQLSDANRGVALNSLGTVASRRGQGDLARGFFQQALEVFRRLTPGSLNVVACLESLADQDRRIGAFDDAEAKLLEALDLCHRLNPEKAGDPHVETSLGAVALERGDLEAASRWLEHASSIWQASAPGSVEQARTLHLLGELHRRKGDLAGADELFGQALNALEAQRGRLGASEDAGALFSRDFAGYYRDRIDVLVELNRSSEAWLVSERYRAQALRAQLAERDLTRLEGVPSELEAEREQLDHRLDAVQRELRDVSDGAGDRGEQLRLELARLRGEHARVTDRIRRASPRFGSIQYPQPLAAPDVRRSLDPGTVLLAYSVGATRTILFVIASGKDRVDTHALPVSESALRDMTERYRDAIAAPWASAAEADALARGLFELLMGPALPDLRSAKRLLLLPDGPLHALPFAALRAPGRNAFVVGWKPIHLAPSATVYAELRRSRSSRGASVVVFGDPAYPDLSQLGDARVSDAAVRREVRRGSRFARLPSSRREAREIVDLFPGRATAYLGEEATEERAKGLPRDVRYVHFACHALLNERSPLDSALALTLRESPAQGQDNGLLQAREILERVRLDADLVTLSACESGLGAERGGEGLVGLKQAFFCAGARSVVASLWKVSDDSTAELMRRFYSHLRGGKPKIEALRSAQVEMVRAGYSPSHWAAFQLDGDWR